MAQVKLGLITSQAIARLIYAVSQVDHAV